MACRWCWLRLHKLSVWHRHHRRWQPCLVYVFRAPPPSVIEPFSPAFIHRPSSPPATLSFLPKFHPIRVYSLPLSLPPSLPLCLPLCLPSPSHAPPELWATKMRCCSGVAPPGTGEKGYKAGNGVGGGPGSAGTSGGMYVSHGWAARHPCQLLPSFYL